MAIENRPYQPTQNSSWKSAEAKFLFDIALGKMLQPEPRNPSDQVVPYLRAANVQWSGVDLSDVAAMYASKGEIESCSIEQGDLLVCEGGEVGRAAIYSGGLSDKAIIQNALHRVRGKNGNSTRYLSYVLRHIAWSGWFDVLCNKATIAHFTVDKFGELQVAYPEPQIQEVIANYLDSETARLDMLISEKQQLLKLLVEKRRALVASFVTQGLNADAPRRDSGIPWLGEIPAHWQSSRIAWLFRERDERNQPELPLLEVSIHAGVRIREFNQDRIEQTAEDFNSYKVARQDDIAFNKMRMWQGAVGNVPCDGLVSPDYVVAEPVTPLCSEYFGLLFRTPAFSAESGSRSHGIVWDRLRLYWEEFRDISVPVPPLEEQRAIVKQIQIETQKMDALAAATERTIALLQERRSALISTAVTGQLEVAS